MVGGFGGLDFFQEVWGWFDVFSSVCEGVVSLGSCYCVRERL